MHLYMRFSYPHFPLEIVNTILYFSEIIKSSALLFLLKVCNLKSSYHFTQILCFAAHLLASCCTFL